MTAPTSYQTDPSGDGDFTTCGLVAVGADEEDAHGRVARLVKEIPHPLASCSHYLNSAGVAVYQKALDDVIKNLRCRLRGGLESGDR